MASAKIEGYNLVVDLDIETEHEGESCETIDYVIDSDGPVRNNAVHPTSIIEQPSYISEGTRIRHFSHIMPNVTTGCNYNVGQNVFIASNGIDFTCTDRRMTLRQRDMAVG